MSIVDLYLTNVATSRIPLDFLVLHVCIPYYPILCSRGPRFREKRLTIKRSLRTIVVDICLFHSEVMIQSVSSI
jgi:hypothetical protein